MGWLIGSSVPPEEPFLQHEQARFEIRERDLYALAGGLEQTCCGGVTAEGGRFLITGFGIQDGVVLQQRDWAERLSNHRTALEPLDGHFVGIYWMPGRIEFFADPNGIRTLYCLERTSSMVFSTRLDWLATYTAPLEIDYVHFGGQWILANSISTKSLVKQVLRLEPGTYAVLENGRIQIKSRSWTFGGSPSDETGDRFERALSQSLAVNGSWSLGLSGGLDSRVLLALRKTCPTHVWGPEDHPDVQISRHIADTSGLHQTYFEMPLPAVDQCIDMVKERVGLTQVITPASAAVERQGYRALHRMGYGVQDGGFGEIARRQLMNQVVFERIFCRDSSKKPLSCPSTGKADFFAPDLHNAMVLSAKQQLSAAWHSLPGSMAIADKADRLSLRSRLPNFFGLEQNYLDHVCVSYMPYAQPSVLRELFQVPLRLRWHGRLLRNIVRKHAPSFSRIPLVKGGEQYPFRLGTLNSHIYCRAKKVMGQSYADPRPRDFIQHVLEFVLDSLRSSSTRTCEIYDQAKLRQMADTAAKGDHRYAAQLDWWLAFDLWRRCLGRQAD